MLGEAIVFAPEILSWRSGARRTRARELRRASGLRGRAAARAERIRGRFRVPALWRSPKWRAKVLAIRRGPGAAGGLSRRRTARRAARRMRWRRHVRGRRRVCGRNRRSRRDAIRSPASRRLRARRERRDRNLLRELDGRLSFLLRHFVFVIACASWLRIVTHC